MYIPEFLCCINFFTHCICVCVCVHACKHVCLFCFQSMFVDNNFTHKIYYKIDHFDDIYLCIVLFCFSLFLFLFNFVWWFLFFSLCCYSYFQFDHGMPNCDHCHPWICTHYLLRFMTLFNQQQQQQKIAEKISFSFRSSISGLYSSSFVFYLALFLFLSVSQCVCLRVSIVPLS